MTRAEKHRETAKAWRLRNLDKVNARQKAYREANKERLRAYQKQYRELHREKRAAYMKAYMQIHGHKYSRSRGERKSYYVPRPKPVSVPRNIITAQFSMTVVCSFCDRKVRRGSPEYYDGELDAGEFNCAACMNNLKLEA